MIESRPGCTLSRSMRPSGPPHLAPASQAQTAPEPAAVPAPTVREPAGRARAGQERLVPVLPVPFSQRAGSRVPSPPAAASPGPVERDPAVNRVKKAVHRPAGRPVLLRRAVKSLVQSAMLAPAGSPNQASAPRASRQAAPDQSLAASRSPASRVSRVVQAARASARVPVEGVRQAGASVPNCAGRSPQPACEIQIADTP